MRKSSKKAKFRGDCWLWPYAATARGYGSMVFNKKNRNAHTWLYEIIKGKIPEGLELDHTCRQHLCVNPEHMEPVTHTENVRRGATSKLTKEQVGEIRILLSAGKNTHKQIAELYGVTRGAVSHIFRSISWNNI